MLLEFNLQPIPKQSVRQGRSQSGKVIFYQDSKYKKYAKSLLEEFKTQVPPGFLPFSGPLEVVITYIFPVLSSMSKKDKDLISSGGYILKTTKPDIIDNLNKAFFDTFEKVLYNNDSQISAFSARKLYGQAPKIILNIQEIPNRYIYP